MAHMEEILGGAELLLTNLYNSKKKKKKKNKKKKNTTCAEIRNQTNDARIEYKPAKIECYTTIFPHVAFQKHVFYLFQ